MEVERKMKKKCYLNPYIFIEFRNGKSLLVDYKNKNEYPLNPPLMQRIIEINRSNLFKNDKIGQELLNNNIIALKPYKKTQWKMGDVSTIFHYGSKDFSVISPNLIHTQEDVDQLYLEYSKKKWSKTPPSILPETTKNLKVIKLPRSQHKKLLTQSLWNTLSTRKTSRSFDGKPIKLTQLSTVLYATFAEQPNLPKEYKKEPFNFIRTKRFRRTSPSAGAMQPTMAYIVVLRVEGLEPGIYFYDCLAHCLKLVSKIDLSDKLAHLLSDQIWANNLSVGVFLTSQFNRISFKYPHPTAYRLLLMEIGLLSQTLLLTATALGLHTWLTNCTSDSEIEKLLKINPNNEQFMLFLGIGIGNNDARWI